MIEKINFQAPMKAFESDGEKLLIHSVFFTIQGEGPHVGKPAVFVRLGGCNLQCPGCDTEYSKGGAFESIDSILTRINMAFGDYKGQRLVVITGGEPFRQNLYPLLHKLHESYIQVQIETNGTLGFMDDRHLRWFHSPLKPQIVVSPKATKVNSDLFPFIVAYKYVLDSMNVSPVDGLPTSVLGMPAVPARPHGGFEGEVYVQPADQPTERNPLHEFRGGEPENYANEQNISAVLNSAMKYGYRVCLQTHKLLGVE